MGNNITKIDDYKGFTALPLADVEDYFNEFALEIEKNILRGNNVDDFGLLGDEVYVNLIADLIDGVPQNAPYINLVNGVASYIDNSGEKTVFAGIKKMLTYFVYSEYLKDNRLTLFQNGTVNMTYENADNTEVKYVNYKAHLRWNKGVDLFNKEVYDYILFNQSDFPNWNFTRQSNFIIHGRI